MIDPNSLRQRLLREAQETGVSVHTLYARHYRKKKPPRPRGAPVNPNSLHQRLLRLSQESGVSIYTLRQRHYAGIPFEKLAEPRRQGAPDAIAIFHRKYNAMLEEYKKTGNPNLPW